MNITRALEVALPELPAKRMAERYPRIPPDVVFKEHIEEGERVVKAVVPGVDAMYSFPPENWQLIEMFNGERSYEEIADLFSQKTGVLYSADVVREFADGVEAMNFWYKTPQEKNIKLMQKSAEERRKLLREKSRWGDLSTIKFPAINPDAFLTWLYKHLSFIFTWWFTALTLAAFAFTIWVFVTHWSEIGHDTFQFYNFNNKTWFDVAVFWIVGASLLCVHEMAHGFTCKHYGAKVPAMGFLLLYLTPAFYTDTTEGEVLGNQHQRLMIAVSGVWSELIICAIATPLWWGTAPGTAIHDLSYLIILFTGIAVILINWNPLMKLDGYYMLCEILGIADLKEASTVYLSSWVKKNVWRLPVEVPYVPKRRRVGYAIYAVLSGLYSYSVLYVFASFIGNIFRNFTHEWAFIPEYGTAYLIFQGRIRTLVNFMKFVYLDKKDRIRRWFAGERKWAAAAAAAVLLLAPIWHESAQGRFVLEPENMAVIRTMVPGIVTQVDASEGQAVRPGAPLFRLRNLQVESKLARTSAGYLMAAARKNAAVFQNADYGVAERERQAMQDQTHTFQREADDLRLEAPIGGVVLTPRTTDWLGAYVAAGTELAQVGETGRLRARIYVSEHDMKRFGANASAKLHVDGMFRKWDAQSVSVSPVSSEIAPNLMDLSKFAGMKAPNFYVVSLLVNNSDGRLFPGMIGTARIYGRRRSVAAFALQAVADFVGRKIW
ncbi:MAG TPA: HlyD family efflux transporter periplasmic adaptor subunit [Terriglobales bacterium]|nr:HlyD family efflux transporter periplasmic adaptor subunit [Terriglobales bacterium]